MEPSCAEAFTDEAASAFSFGGQWRRCHVTGRLTRLDDAARFYRDVLGLKLEDDSPFALVFRSPNAAIRIQKVQSLHPAPHTALGWTVADLRAAVQSLAAKGVAFERYHGLPQDDLAIWLSPSGARVCWFKDPDGKVLSLTEYRW